MVIHLARVILLAAIVLLIHRGHQQRVLIEQHSPANAVPLEVVVGIFPTATEVHSRDADGMTVVDAAGATIGRLVQTSPAADRIIGFSGPTNVLLAFGPEGRIQGVRILSSRDTREHAAQVAADPRFLRSYEGLTRDAAATRTPIDGVTGATLTSLAIAESIQLAVGGDAHVSRFPAPFTAADVRSLFEGATTLTVAPDVPGLYRVQEASGRELGFVLRGSPAVDGIIGYQGPTDLLIGLRPTAVGSADVAESSTLAQGGEQVTLPDGSAGATGAAVVSPVEGGMFRGYAVAGILVAQSFDNEPYVTYVRDDRYFFKVFTGRSVGGLAALDLQAARVEGVSGATMTSLAVAQGLTAAARQLLADSERAAASREAKRFRLSARDWGTGIVTLLGVLLGLSRWRARPWVRQPWMIVLVGYLGFVNGDLVSQALLAGWAKNGAAWRTMCGPLLLTAAALLVPVFTRRNVYCTHLCPHGAAQQLLRRRVARQVPLGPRLHRLLGLIPGLLLMWVVVVTVTGSAFSLVDIEPFDAYVPLIAGAPALVLFGTGLVASLFVPMAYCRYGCPTGGLLSWLRRRGRHDRLGAADLAAAVCLGLALALS